MDQLLERKARIPQGIWIAVGLLVLISIGLVLLKGSVTAAAGIELNHIQDPLLFVSGLGLLGLAGFGVTGFCVVEPNQARLLLLLGHYIGSITEPGFYWIPPLLVQSRLISLRVRNFVSDRIKVNDAQGSPIEIATVVRQLQ